jgi:hypothetical protein
VKPSSTTGTTLLELLVALVILCFVLGLPLMMFRSSERLQNTAVTRAELDSRARRALEQVAGRLELSGADVIPQSALGAGMGADTVDLQVATDWNGAAVVWAPQEQIALVESLDDPDDGDDNDSDGRVDERRVVWTTDVGLPTQRTTVLCEDVAEALAGEIPGNLRDDNGNGLIDERGLVFQFIDDRVVVRLTLQGRESSGAIVAVFSERTIAFRN